MGLQGLEGDLLGLVEGGPVDRLELAHELSLERLVIGVRPGSVFLEGLGDADLEVEAAAADLPGDLGARKLLQLRKVLVQERLAGLEALGITRSAGRARGVLSSSSSSSS